MEIRRRYRVIVLVWCHCVSDVLTLWSGLLFLSPRVCSQHGSSSNIGGPACLYTCVCVREQVLCSHIVRLQKVIAFIVSRRRHRGLDTAQIWHANFWDYFSYTCVRCLIAGSTPQSAPPVTHTVCPVGAVTSPASRASPVLTLKDPFEALKQLHLFLCLVKKECHTPVGSLRDHANDTYKK